MTGLFSGIHRIYTRFLEFIEHTLASAALLPERMKLKTHDATPFDATPRFISICLYFSLYHTAHSIRFILRARHGGEIAEWKTGAEAEGQDHLGRTAATATDGGGRRLSLRIRRGHRQL